MKLLLYGGTLCETKFRGGTLYIVTNYKYSGDDASGPFMYLHFVKVFSTV